MDHEQRKRYTRNWMEECRATTSFKEYTGKQEREIAKKKEKESCDKDLQFTTAEEYMKVDTDESDN